MSPKIGLTGWAHIMRGLATKADYSNVQWGVTVVPSRDSKRAGTNPDMLNKVSCGYRYLLCNAVFVTFS